MQLLNVMQELFLQKEFHIIKQFLNLKFCLSLKNSEKQKNGISDDGEIEGRCVNINLNIKIPIHN